MVLGIRSLLVALALSVSAGHALATQGCPAIPRRNPMPVEAVPQIVPVDEWKTREEQVSRNIAGHDLSKVKLVFLGDSITQGWDPTMWDLFWGGKSPLNMGLWGDLTQGVLWRLNNGQWDDALNPELVVLLIGTNNAGWHSNPEDTALGVAEIIRFINKHSPSSKILLLGVLPRGPDKSAPERPINTKVNELIQRCADGKSVIFLDPGQAMVAVDGRISTQVLFDYLHPTMVGYAILGGAIQAQVQALVN